MHQPLKGRLDLHWRCSVGKWARKPELCPPETEGLSPSLNQIWETGYNLASRHLYATGGVLNYFFWVQCPQFPTEDPPKPTRQPSSIALPSRTYLVWDAPVTFACCHVQTTSSFTQATVPALPWPLCLQPHCFQTILDGHIQDSESPHSFSSSGGPYTLSPCPEFTLSQIALFLIPVSDHLHLGAGGSKDLWALLQDYVCIYLLSMHRHSEIISIVK